MLDFSIAHKSQNSLRKEYNLKKGLVQMLKNSKSWVFLIFCFYKLILVKIQDALSSEFQGCSKRAKEKTEKKLLPPLRSALDRC